MDNLLLSRLTKKGVTDATIGLLNFLGQQGLRVSKTKLQFVEEKFKHLEYLISKGKYRLHSIRPKSDQILGRPLY
jgi:hypothetical protein